MPEGDSALFLHASGPWETARVWKCDDCSAHGDYVFTSDPEPREHVVETGHTVVMAKIAEMIIFPVATQPPG
jgi:hypothetical protein